MKGVGEFCRWTEQLAHRPCDGRDCGFHQKRGAHCCGWSAKSKGGAAGRVGRAVPCRVLVEDFGFYPKMNGMESHRSYLSMKMRGSDLLFEYYSICWGTNWRVPGVGLELVQGLLQ